MGIIVIHIHVDVHGTHISDTIGFDKFIKHFPKKQEGIRVDALFSFSYA
jgi:hypothetical protein